MQAGLAELEVEKLLHRVRATARADSPGELRRAYEEVLEALELTPTAARAWRDGLDIVGTAYERLISATVRRAAGQFFTPFWAGELMAGWLLEEPAKLLVDLGCGSGGLFIPAARHPLRQRCRIKGIDKDPLAITMATANRRLQGLRRVDLELRDFLLDGLDAPADRFICNPPYARANSLDAADRIHIHDALEAFFGRRFSSRLSLQTLFLLRALEFSTADARLAFITPSNWLDVDSGADAKACLLDHAHVEALIFFEADHLFFDGPLTTALITLIQKRRSASAPTKIVRLGRDLPAPDDLLAAIRRAEASEVDSVSLKPNVRWARPKPRSRHGIELGDLVRVHRGIATGANAFFCLTEDERERRGIPRDQLRPCITSPRVFRGEVLTAGSLERMPGNIRRWLVDCDDHGAESERSPLGVYLRRGRRLKIHHRHLPAKRRLWYRQEQRDDAPILFSYFNRSRARFVRNLAEAVPLNNWLVIEPYDDVDPDLLFTALSASPLQQHLHDHARIYGRGLWKLEPSELQRIVLPPSAIGTNDWGRRLGDAR